MPFELKTGMPYVDHKAQVLLYMLLMSDRYGISVFILSLNLPLDTSVTSGLLFYLNPGNKSVSITYNFTQKPGAALVRNTILPQYGHMMGVSLNTDEVICYCFSHPNLLGSSNNATTKHSCIIFEQSSNATSGESFVIRMRTVVLKHCCVQFCTRYAS